MSIPEFHTQHIFVADDDEEDRLLFERIVNDLPYLGHLTVARDGEQTLNLLNELPQLPDLLLLDLNIPFKNGLECLRELKQIQKLKSIPVVIFSNSLFPGVVDQVYEAGAHLYIRKPDDLAHFKKLIQHVLLINWKDNPAQPPREEFVLTIYC